MLVRLLFQLLNGFIQVLHKELEEFFVMSRVPSGALLEVVLGAPRGVVDDALGEPVMLREFLEFLHFGFVGGLVVGFVLLVLLVLVRRFLNLNVGVRGSPPECVVLAEHALLSALDLLLEFLDVAFVVEALEELVVVRRGCSRFLFFRAGRLLLVFYIFVGRPQLLVDVVLAHHDLLQLDLDHVRSVILQLPNVCVVDIRHSPLFGFELDVVVHTDGGGDGRKQAVVDVRNLRALPRLLDPHVELLLFVVHCRNRPRSQLTLELVSARIDAPQVRVLYLRLHLAHHVCYQPRLLHYSFEERRQSFIFIRSA